MPNVWTEPQLIDDVDPPFWLVYYHLDHLRLAGGQHCETFQEAEFFIWMIQYILYDAQLWDMWVGNFSVGYGVEIEVDPLRILEYRR